MLGRTMERLEREECIKLMERHPAGIGRIALAGSRPVIFPVNYAIDRGSVIFRTDPGKKLDEAVRDSIVAFEVDWVEPSWQLGWSVLVQGHAHVVTDKAEIARLRRLPLVSWAEGDKEHFVRIDSDLVSGRRLEE